MKKRLSPATVLGLSAMSFFCALLVVSFPAQAQKNAYFGVGTGVFKVYAEDKENDLNAYGLISYRPGLEIFGYGLWSTFACTDREFYLSGGILQDFYLMENVVLTPKFGLGIYTHNDGYDLGSPLEFSPAIQISYELDDRSRIGLRFVHVSNANLGKENSGANAVSILYSVPINGK